MFTCLHPFRASQCANQLARCCAPCARQRKAVCLVPCRGFTANLIRNSVISATELVSYDTVKALLLEKLGLQEGMGVHFTAGLSAGLAATALGSPADVVGTRLMAQVRSTSRCHAQNDNLHAPPSPRGASPPSGQTSGEVRPRRKRSEAFFWEVWSFLTQLLQPNLLKVVSRRMVSDSQTLRTARSRHRVHVKGNVSLTSRCDVQQKHLLDIHRHVNG